MAWQRRGRKDYYYRSRRRGRHVQRQYLGSGAEAQVAAALDSQRRREHQARRDAQRADRGRWAGAAAVLVELAEITDLLVRAALLGAGYHNWRGAWRRKRR